LLNTHGHKLRFPAKKKAQFVTALGIFGELKLRTYPKNALAAVPGGEEYAPLWVRQIEHVFRL